MHACGLQLGELFDTPAFAWLDAYQTKRTAFFVSIQAVDCSASEDRPPIVLESYAGSAGTGYAAGDGSGVRVLMHGQPPAVHKMKAQLVAAAAARL
jgi:hypothetical protein